MNTMNAMTTMEEPRGEKVETLKAEPVRRGIWLEGSRVVRVYACSVCGWELYEKTDYCPYCGANMYELEGL